MKGSDLGVAKDSNRRAKYLAKNTAIFALGSIATKMISFFLVPIYTNILSTEEYGTVDLVNTICLVLAPILIMNISESVMRFSLDKDADHVEIMSVGYVYFSIAIILGLLIVPTSKLFESVSNYSWYIYFYTITLAGSQILLCYLRGKEQLIRYAIGNIIHTATIAIFNILYLVVLKQGIEGYFKAYIWSGAITMFYAFIAGNAQKVLFSFKWNGQLAGNMAKYSVVLIPNTFMWWIMNSLDRIMVTALVGVAANGIYAVSYKLPSLVSILTNIFNKAWGYSAIKENESVDRDEYSNKVFQGVVGISAVTGAVLLTIMKPFLRIYVEKSYFIAWRYTPCLIVGSFFLTLATFLGTSYTVNKDSKGYLFSACCGAAVNLVCNYLFIPAFGVMGAALATCLSYITVFLYRTVDTQKYLKLQVFTKRTILAYGFLILTAALIFIDDLWGELMMVATTMIEIMIFKDIWNPILHSLLKKIGLLRVKKQ